MKQLVIFDLDGTLLNTIADLGAAVNHALLSMGFSEHPLASYNYMVGNGVRKLIERASPDSDPATLQRMLDHFREYYDVHCTDTTEPYKGIPELLESLTAHGIGVAVATNKYQSAAERIIKHYFPTVPFTSILGQTEGRPTKPDPSILFETLSVHPTKKQDVLYCGDSAVDIETARRACVDSVGVSWGFRPVSELKRACADNIVGTPAEILALALRNQ